MKDVHRWRETTREELRRDRESRRVDEPAHGSLAADLDRYLALVATMPTFAQRKEHLSLWVEALGPHTPRASVTAEQIRAVLQQWRLTLAAATCNKRRTALMHFWTVLDGKGERNPVRGVPKFRVDDPLPRGRDPHAIDARLRQTSACRSRASCRVLLWTGMRPAELERAEPDDLDLARAHLIIRTAKHGRTRTIPLTSQAVTAWKEFDRLECWGHVPQAAPLGRWLKDHTGIAGLRVYDLRHTYGTALARAGTRLDVIAAMMGHSTLEMARRYVLAAVSADALTATRKLSAGKLPRKVTRRKRGQKHARKSA